MLEYFHEYHYFFFPHFFTSQMMPQRLDAKIVHVLDSKKALHIRAIPMTHQSSVMDTMIIATGTSIPHLSALVKSLSPLYAEAPVLSVSGLPGTSWVIVDFGGVVVHLFTQETRDFYDLESMWQPDAFQPE